VCLYLREREREREKNTLYNTWRYADREAFYTLLLVHGEILFTTKHGEMWIGRRLTLYSTWGDFAHYKTWRDVDREAFYTLSTWIDFAHYIH
jgi:hypothetical protein